MSPELLITLAKFVAERERKGSEWCRKRGVGRVRELLGVVPAGNVVELNPSQYGELQSSAGEILAAHCRACGRCKLARE